ncbi:MAG: relaxase/mobilization nuclease domain-containing protein [Acetobacteraceae bacterium]
MILKASQRGGGQDLAVHLMNSRDNEHILIHELRGFLADDLEGAFKEAEAVSRGTKCRQYLFSLSLNPPEQERVPVEDFEQAVDRIEERLGLTGQPRAIIFHEKEGRRHAHCVWSRIDTDTMTARQMSFFKRKLVGISRDLYLEHGWTMPRGIANALERDPTNFSLAEWQQAKRQGIDPRALKQTLQDCWARSDDGRTFRRSLEENGFFLANGDRRSLVVLGYDDEVHSLPRALGLKTKEVQARLGDGSDLPSVAEAKLLIGERMTPSIKRHIDESRERFRQRAAVLGRHRTDMAIRHRQERKQLQERQTTEWGEEVRQRAVQRPTGLRAIWQRLTGQSRKLRAELEARAEHTRHRHMQERQTVIDAQLTERRRLQTEYKALREKQARVLIDLRRDLVRYRQWPAIGAPMRDVLPRSNDIRRTFDR